MKRRILVDVEIGIDSLSMNSLARNCGIYEVMCCGSTFDYAGAKEGDTV